MKPLHIETALLHGAYATEEITGATVPPIFQSTSFARKTAEELEILCSIIWQGKTSPHISIARIRSTLWRFRNATNSAPSFEDRPRRKRQTHQSKEISIMNDSVSMSGSCFATP